MHGGLPRRMTKRLRAHLLVLVILIAGWSAANRAQELDVPKDSTRITVTGCARGRTFIVGERSDREPVRSDIGPGSRLRIAAAKTILQEMKPQERSLIEITGLVRTADIGGPGGLSLLGGRLRLGGSPASTDPRTVMAYNEVVIDLESWRPLPETCR
jgi:hypothetical protein